ncbi:MAG: glycosyltransferase family 2 protein, partial [Candidatus Omnitrophota bacterium]
MTAVQASVLIPVFSEVEQLRRTVEVLQDTCGDYLREIILLMHRDSIPACKELCRELAEKDPRVHVHEQIEYPGQGHAFREGFALATGTHVLMMNADLETDPADARKLIE